MINEEIAKVLAKFDTQEEALAYLQNEGIELTDEELDEIAGGQVPSAEEYNWKY